MKKPVRVRFAPSPTGYLHIGGVRTALFNWLFARQHDGTFILRIDDTDRQRNVESALEPILAGFRWLGLDWDEGPGVDGPHAPYYQSQRIEKHQAAVSVLLEKNLAYRDYARPEELQALREAAEKAKKPFVYDRCWMAETEEQAAEWESEGREAVVRLKMPREGHCRFTDRVRGEVSFEWAGEQDHVIQRSDGSCLYHLTSAVDDGDFAISHIIRAIEHLANTPRQIFIMEGLGYELPEFAHLPYVAEPGSSSKLSKRKLKKYLKNPDFLKLFELGARIMERQGAEIDPETFNPVLVDFYREIGFLPEALVNYLLLLGWSLDDRTEDFSRAEMIRHFSLERVNKSPASFDPVKLQAFQERHMRDLTMDEKLDLVLPYLRNADLIADPVPTDKIQAILRAAEDRIKLAGDILDYNDLFCRDDDLEYDEKTWQKRLVKPPQAALLLREYLEDLKELTAFDAAALETHMKGFAEARELGLGKIIHAVRVAVTGKGVGFGMFETLEILGRERVLARLEQALEKLARESGSSYP